MIADNSTITGPTSNKLLTDSRTAEELFKKAEIMFQPHHQLDVYNFCGSKEVSIETLLAKRDVSVECVSSRLESTISDR